MTSARRTALLVEDHQLTSTSVAFLLAQQGVESTTWLGSQLAEVLRDGRELPASVVLLDLELDQGIDGSTLIPALVERGCTVIVCSGERPERLGACIEAGASGAVRKTQSASQIVDAVARAFDGDAVMSIAARTDLLAETRRKRAEAEARIAPLAQLTPGEADVLVALSDGIAPAAIAASRSVSVKTVRNQIEAILVKLGVHSQLEAVALAANSGWLAAAG